MAANDNANLIIPVSKFFANATLPGSGPEKPASYTIGFGAFEKGVMKVSGETKKLFEAYNGRLGLAALKRIKAELSYEFECRKLAPAVLAYWMGSTSGSAPVPGKIVDIYGWVGIESEDEAIVPASNTNEGAGILVHHSFKGALRIEGDFTADGSDVGMMKIMVDVYLGSVPGVWTAATRPVTPAGP